MKLRNFIKDKRANVSVGVVCIVMMCVTFIVWLVTYTPVAMLTDVVRGMTTDHNALRVLGYVNASMAILLIGELVVLLVWWLTSSFRREDQSYSVGAGY